MESCRRFTPSEELRLLEGIKTKFLDKGLFYNDPDFKHDALEFHRQLVKEAEDEALAAGRTGRIRVPLFKCSRQFIQDFRDRHKLSLRRPRIKRRGAVTDEIILHFIKKVEDLKRAYPLERIINIDETNWRTVEAGFKTWGVKGAESVHCNADNDDKEGVRVIAAVDAAGRKLPLTVIGKGNTKRRLAGYALPSEVWGEYSDTGWTTSDIMCCHLWHLRHELFHEGPLVIILDTYAAHRAKEVREIAQLWGIELVFIPPGCTDRLQPLDRRVFGVLKAYARQMWRTRYHDTGGEKVTRQVIIEQLLEAWRRISPMCLKSAWFIYEDESDDDEEERELGDGEYRPFISLHDLTDL
jgi:hypothetical protein